MAIVWKEPFIIKDEIPTARFWLMCKMAFKNTKSENIFNRSWEIYISDLKTDLVNNMELINTSSKKIKDPDREKREMADKTIVTIERSAYLTIPASFLTTLKIPRVLRH